jgi:Kef-type K+ transport system membrane component KefB
MSAASPSVTFFIQMFFILVACRLVGLLARRVGQPQVIGEMVAGVLMGPSLFGHFLPDWQGQIFPKDSLKVIQVGAQLGIALYMFLVGLDFRLDHFKSRARSAASVAMAGIIAPFALGAAIAVWLIKSPGFFPPQVTLWQAALFLGASMSITAFPVLARIIQERGMNGTPLAAMALSAGAMNDAAAWCVLAVVLASFGGGPMVAVSAIVGGLLYSLFVLTVGRKWLVRLGEAVDRDGQLTVQTLSTVLVLLMLAAWITDAIGIHAVFGGFILGVAMPRGLIARELQKQLNPFAVVFLIPMFFCYSGLNTRLDAVASPQLLWVAAVVLAAAILGKGVACWAAARFHGEDNRTAMALGTLMNARGMMELILLNIGLQRGIIEAPLFSILVLMAVVTTMMTSPLFEWVYGRHLITHAEAADHSSKKRPPKRS